MALVERLPSFYNKVDLLNIIMYVIYLSVNCEWDNWVVGNCSVTCGNGTQINTRAKKVNATDGGIDCEGESFENKPCNLTVCPGKALWNSIFLK